MSKFIHSQAMHRPSIAQELNPISLPLGARHLIEASAGTGKTFNITRLYVRLLLEKSYSVQEILVMTFTDAATEEIRSRVAEFIDEVLQLWDTDDAFVLALQQSIDKAHGRRLLESAKLTIDDASIFTIHGFCQRVITQFSMSMRQDPDSKIIPQTEPLIMQAIADAIIALNKDSKDFAILQSCGWHTPTKFYNGFRTLLYYQEHITLLSARQIWCEYVESVNQHWQSVKALRNQLSGDIQSSQNWLEGLAQTPKNSQKIMAEKDGAIIFLDKHELLSQAESEAIFEEMTKADYALNPSKLIIDEGLLKLFSTARAKKYPAQWFVARKHAYDLILNPIQMPLQGQSKQRLEKRLQLSHAHRVALQIIQQVQGNVYSQMQRDSLHSYDDLIRIVAQTLAGKHADVISSHLLKQFPAALIDEFQDTDQQQYGIFSRLYPKGDSDSTLIMIGDPKQAIYGFRGGDVFTYLQAREDADFLWSMNTNWRSTQDMVAAYNFVFANKFNDKVEATSASASVFDYGIDYAPVLAAQGNQIEASHLRVANQACSQALQFICADAYNEEDRFTDLDVQRLQIIQWMINEIKVLLCHGVINDKEGERQVQEKDIAILVRAGFEADLIKQHFQQHSIASVYLSEKAPLFDSQQARYLHYVLDAIWTGNDQRRCITALATGIFYKPKAEGASPVCVATLIADRTHPQWQSVYKQNAVYRQMWQKQGIYTLVLHLIKEQFVLENANENPERALTNYQHLAELLAQASIMHTTQSSQLMWLAKHINQIDNSETAQLRLESDQALIKIVTQHKSKGLEYPVVFLPFANIARKGKSTDIIKYHDHHNALVMQLGASETAAKAMQQEDLAEDMRLLYVALTRPIYRCYLGMLSSDTANISAIHRALQLPALSLDQQSDVDIDGKVRQTFTHTDETQYNFADTLVDNIMRVTDHQNAITARKASVLTSDLDLPKAKHLPVLSVRQITRTIQQNWMLTSFTGITRLMHAKSAEADESSRLIREPELADNLSTNKNLTVEPQTPLYQARSSLLRFAMSKGANTGNILHDTFEWLSFSAHCLASSDAEQTINTPALKAEVLHKIALRHQAFIGVDINQYSHWIIDCLNAPLRTQLTVNQPFCLASLPDDNTIKETEFYLPIDQLESAGLENLLRSHRQRVATEFGFTAVPVNKLSKRRIAGMLHGFIDLIFMTDNQYWVCDYKSTHLGNDYSDYTPVRLALNIQQHDYDLQYLLYAMALHRFLEQSVSDYQPLQHFGGVYYLYVRGMTGAPEQLIKGRSPGVFFTPIEVEELASLNRLFTGNETRIRSNK